MVIINIKKLMDNSRGTGGEFHVDSGSYPRVMSGGDHPVMVMVVLSMTFI